MCYMTGGRQDRVGVRALRQNLSVYLRRVEEGETLEVTDRGRPVAVLAPLPADASPIQRLRAGGRIARPASGPISEILPTKGTPSAKLSEALQAVRDDRV
jgi:prevent-host-death family protein